jgi:hypothetical protein
LTTTTWELNIGPTIVEDEIHTTWWLFQDYVGCFVFNLEELGQLKG